MQTARDVYFSAIGKQRAVVAVMTLVVAAGCGSTTSAVSPRPIKGIQLPVGSTWVVWHLGFSSPSSTSVTVFFNNGLEPVPPCTIPTRAVVRETVSEVEIGLVAPLPKGSNCAMPGVARTFKIHLSSPLGTRRIVDLATR